MNDHIATLIDVLCDSGLANDKAAVCALSQLQKLKKDTLTISSAQTRNLVREALYQVSTSLKTEVQTKQRIELTKLRNEFKQNLQKLEQRVEDLEVSHTANSARIDKLEQSINTEKSGHDEDYEKFKKDLKDDLLKHYKERYSNLPLAFLSVLDVPLNDIYVPPLIILNRSALPSSPKRNLPLDLLQNYKDIFSHKGRQLKNIYIQGDSGTGKTTFSSKLCIDWCNAVINSTEKIDYSDYFSDKDYLKRFQFVFLITLRNLTKTQCDINGMVLTAVVENLARKREYSTNLLERLLSEEECLIILDGLDEWRHPDNSECNHFPKGIPRRSSGTKCTFVTLTRPWRLNDLRESHIDVLYSVKGVIDKKLLLAKVIRHLNRTQNLNRNINDFTEAALNVDDLLNVPLMAIQLVCLWYEPKAFTESKCQIYFRMIEMLGQINSTYAEVKSGDVHSLPVSQCTFLQQHHEYGWCLKHSILMERLGKLAFYTIHSSNGSAYIVFSHSQVKQYMSQKDIDTACSKGILTQQRVLCLNNQVCSYTYLHRTYQEFFAAYYLAINEAEFDKLAKQMWLSYKSHIEFKELYVFVCGLNPSVSKKLSDAIFSDETLFQSDVFDGFSAEKAAQLSVAGETEHTANGYEPFTLPVRWVTYGVSCESLREHSELDSVFYSPFTSFSNITECLHSHSVTIACLFLNFNRLATDLFEVFPMLEKLKNLKLIDLKYDAVDDFMLISKQTPADNWQKSMTLPNMPSQRHTNVDQTGPKQTTFKILKVLPKTLYRRHVKCQHSIKLPKTLTKGHFNISVAECRRCKAANPITLDFTRCSNLDNLFVVSSTCTVDINSKRLKDIGLVGNDMSKGNIVKVLKDSKFLETVRISHCRNIPSTLCMGRPRHLHITGIKGTFQPHAVSHYLSKTQSEDFIADAVWFTDTDPPSNTLPCLILCFVELRGELTKPSCLHDVKIIEEKDKIGFSLSMQLCDNFQNIVLIWVELKGYGIVFSNNIERLAFIHVKMSLKSWIKTLESLPAQLEHLVLQNIEMNNDLHLLSSSSLLLEKSLQNVFMETLPNFPKSLKTLYISQQMEIGDIKVTLLESLKMICLENISMKVSSWKQLIDDIKGMPDTNCTFITCKILPVEEGDIVRERLAASDIRVTEWTLNKEYIVFSAGLENLEGQFEEYKSILQNWPY